MSERELKQNILRYGLYIDSPLSCETTHSIQSNEKMLINFIKSIAMRFVSFRSECSRRWNKRARERKKNHFKVVFGILRRDGHVFCIVLQFDIFMDYTRFAEHRTAPREQMNIYRLISIASPLITESVTHSRNFFISISLRFSFRNQFHFESQTQHTKKLMQTANRWERMKKKSGWQVKRCRIEYSKFGTYTLLDCVKYAFTE